MPGGDPVSAFQTEGKEVKGNMPTWTLVEAQEQLAMWKAALMAVSTGQSYTIGTRSLTRANLKDIMAMIQYFGNEVDRQEAVSLGKPHRKVRRYVPRDT